MTGVNDDCDVADDGSVAVDSADAAGVTGDASNAGVTSDAAIAGVMTVPLRPAMPLSLTARATLIPARLLMRRLLVATAGL